MGAAGRLGCTNQTSLMGGRKASSPLHPAPGSAKTTAQCEDSDFFRTHLGSRSLLYTPGVRECLGNAGTHDYELKSRKCSFGPHRVEVWYLPRLRETQPQPHSSVYCCPWCLAQLWARGLATSPSLHATLCPLFRFSSSQPVGCDHWKTHVSGGLRN